MTEFIAELRHYCRNPKCRTKLPNPAANPREAFCARGCHSGFYRSRGLVCEGPMVRKTEHQKVCRKSKCRNAFRARIDLGCYHPTGNVISPSKPADFIGPKQPLKHDRPWRIVAGRMTANQNHCATVPDGPHGQWAGGDYRIEARNTSAYTGPVAQH